MAELITLARPYAKAAFDYAKEQGTINQWETFLSAAQQVVSDEAFLPILQNPGIAAEQKARVLLDICDPIQNHSPMKQMLNSVSLPEGVDIKGLIQQMQSSEQGPFYNFVQQLASHDRLGLLPEIATIFERLKSTELKQVDAYVVSAYPLTDDERSQLLQGLQDREQATVVLHESVDESLLGGATIKVGDKFTDGSVRGKLTQLKTQLGAIG